MGRHQLEGVDNAAIGPGLHLIGVVINFNSLYILLNLKCVMIYQNTGCQFSADGCVTINEKI